MKKRFENSLQHLYPGKWDPKYVMRQVGNNIREKHVKLMSSFKKYTNKESVPCSGLNNVQIRRLFHALVVVV
jgi:hypothetical protein